MVNADAKDRLEFGIDLLLNKLEKSSRVKSLFDVVLLLFQITGNAGNVVGAVL